MGIPDTAPDSSGNNSAIPEKPQQLNQPLNVSQIYPTVNPTEPINAGSEEPYPGEIQTGSKHSSILYIMVIFLILGAGGGLIYWRMTSKKTNQSNIASTSSVAPTPITTPASTTTPTPTITPTVSGPTGYFGTLSLAQKRALDVQTKSNMHNLANQLDFYYNGNSEHYPQTESYNKMIELLLNSHALTTKPTDNSSEHIYKYCSSNPDSYNLEVNLLATSEILKNNRPTGNGQTDNCTPGP